MCILLYIIQDRKTIKGSKIFEIKAEQNQSFTSLFEAFLELQGIDTDVRNALLLLYCMKTKIQSALIITSEKQASVQWRLL